MGAIMRIDGLTDFDIQILDTIWAIETNDEINKYLATLNPDTRQRTLTLMELVTLSAIDDEVEQMVSYPEVESLLDSIL